jgi:hypothetical protein
LAVTEDCLFPWPNDFLTREDPQARTGRRLAIPDGALEVPSRVPPLDVTPYNRADGAPTTAPILVHVGGPVGTEHLVDALHPMDSLRPGSAIAVFEVGSGRRVPYLAEMDQNIRGDPERAALIVRPLGPLPFGARVAVAVRRSLRMADGSAPPPSYGFEALRDGTPAQDPRVESARARYETLFAFLAAQGYPREELYLAWDYTTASREHVLGPLLTLREAVFARADGPGVAVAIERVEESPDADTARVVYGTFTPPNFLRADNTMAFDAAGRPALQVPERAYPFTMVIPARARTEARPLPLVLFGHGIFGSGRDYLVGGPSRLVRPIAQRFGAVLVATDWIGLSAGDQALLTREIIPDLNRIGVVTDRLLQSVANALALLEASRGAIQRDPRVRFGDGPLLDPERTYYYGVSLGGIQGTTTTAMSRHITRAVVAVPGASWSNMLPRSYVYAPIKLVVDATYPDPLTQQAFLSLLQGRFDPVDPSNAATAMFREPPPGAPAGRRVLVQESIGDCLVPNQATEMLARALGVPQLTPAVATIFGLSAVTSPAEGSALTQFALTPQLRGYTPPETNTVPSRDNGVHADMVGLSRVIDQVGTFLSEGRVEQRCDGACDPD